MSDEHAPRLIQDGHKSKIQVTDEVLQRTLSPLTGGTRDDKRIAMICAAHTLAWAMAHIDLPDGQLLQEVMNGLPTYLKAARDKRRRT